jgi:hypothetical protein
LSALSDDTCSNPVDVSWRELAQTIMMMLLIVPGEEFLKPASGMTDIAESPWVVRLVLDGVEM